MTLNRPDLSKVDSEIRTYIEYLETELTRLRANEKKPSAGRSSPRIAIEEPADVLPELSEPPEPETTINVITATASGIAKRTPRHLYSRQRRGGMGIFDLDTSPEDAPIALAIADQQQSLLLFTNLGRAFRLPVSAIPETPVRARGESLFKKLSLLPEESLTTLLPDRAQGYVALVSQTGMVRLLRHHVFGEYMKPGTPLYDRNFGPLAAACWTPGDGDLLIATRQGRAIRFSEKLVPPAGILGIRMSEGDSAISITPVYSESNVFMLSADGKGSIRQMENFTPNKAPGAGGKIAINTDHLICAMNADEIQDIFIISRLSKIIRFPVSDIPPKDSIVQGVICMSLRADEPVSVALNPIT